MAKAATAAATVTAVTYKVTQDCLVFGTYHTAGDTFTEKPWDKAYNWPMPDFIEVVGESTTDTPDEAAPLG